MLTVKHTHSQLLLPLVTLLLPISAYTAEWSVNGSLNPAISYDDNVFMSENEQGSVKYSATPTLNLSRAQDDNRQTFSIGYVGQRYTSFSYLNQQYPFARLSSSFDAERSSWGLDASYVERSSRSLAEEDTGDFTTETTVTTQTIAPSYSYKLTERDSLSFSASYADTTSTTDSEVLSFKSGWSRQFTERLNGGLNLSVTNYQSTTGLLSSTDDYTYRADTSINYQLSELWKISGNIGVRQLEAKRTNNNITQESSNSGLFFKLSANKKTELGSLSLGASRSITPSITGDVNTSDRLNVSWSKRITERLSTSFSSSYQETSSATEETSDKRKNLNLSPAINWSIEPDLGLSLAYNYRQQKYTASNQDVSSNSLMLTLNYNWDGFSVSR